MPFVVPSSVVVTIDTIWDAGRVGSEGPVWDVWLVDEDSR